MIERSTVAGHPIPALHRISKAVAGVLRTAFAQNPSPEGGPLEAIRRRPMAIIKGLLWNRTLWVGVLGLILTAFLP